MQRASAFSVIARIDRIAAGGELYSCILLHGVRLVIYRGVEYSVTATSEPDVWQWRFQIGERSAVGKTRTRLINMAARRVHMKIDAALKGARPLVQSDELKS